MREVTLLWTTGDQRIDALLGGLIEQVELAFHGRIRSSYLLGSYAAGSRLVYGVELRDLMPATSFDAYRRRWLSGLPAPQSRPGRRVPRPAPTPSPGRARAEHPRARGDRLLDRHRHHRPARQPNGGGEERQPAPGGAASRRRDLSRLGDANHAANPGGGFGPLFAPGGGDRRRPRAGGAQPPPRGSQGGLLVFGHGVPSRGSGRLGACPVTSGGVAVRMDRSSVGASAEKRATRQAPQAGWNPGQFRLLDCA